MLNHSIIEILEMLQVKIELIDLLHLVPCMSPRYFTIASSPKNNAKIIRLVVKILGKKFEGERSWTGLISKYFESLFTQINQCKTSPLIYAKKTKSTLQGFDSKIHENVLMIGTGSGIAPFIGMMEEMEKGGMKMLVFGNRSSKKDFLYKDFILDKKAKGILTELRTVFSREEKIYVQDFIKTKGNIIKDFFNKKNSVCYICGNPEMVKQVYIVFSIFLNEIGQSVKYLEDEKKLFKEAW